MRATILSVVWLLISVASGAAAQDVTAPKAEVAPEADIAPSADDATEPAEPSDRNTAPAPSRVDSSAPLSGGERWVKDNGRWRLQRINYRYLDHANYAPRPAPPQTIDDFPEPRVVLSTRWFGRSGWGFRATPVWGLGWSNGWNGGWGSGFGVYGGSPWTAGVSPWSPWGYGGWRGVPRYGWGHRGYGSGYGGGYGGRSRFGFSFGWGGFGY